MYYIYVDGNCELELYDSRKEVEDYITKVLSNADVTAGDITVIEGVDVKFTVTPATGPSVRLQ